MRTEYSNWRKLDNAALAFPLVTGENDTRVFRFYCQLKEEVDSDILQQALDQNYGEISIVSGSIAKGSFLVLSGAQPYQGIGKTGDRAAL